MFPIAARNFLGWEGEEERYLGMLRVPKIGQLRKVRKGNLDAKLEFWSWPGAPVTARFKLLSISISTAHNTKAKRNLVEMNQQHQLASIACSARGKETNVG